MIIKLKTIEELKKDFLVAFRNNSGDKVTKISPTSIINGFAYGTSKIVQKINSDAALLETKLFPEYASGSYLEDISNREGYPVRGSASKSSVILLFKGENGTVYPLGTQVKSASGVIVETKLELTLGLNKFGYVLAESTLTGSDQNIENNTLNILVSTAPAGHISVTNTVRASGGTDVESDYNYKKRILNSNNILGKNTVAFYEALIRYVNSDVLRVTNEISNRVDNRFNLLLVKNSGADFTTQELTDIKNEIMQYVPLSDYGDETFIISNLEYTYFDMYVPLKLKSGYILENVLTQMQININNYIDLNKWEFGDNVLWEYLLSICLNTEGIKEIDEANFIPMKDIEVTNSSLPRLRNFSVKNLLTDDVINQINTPQMWNYNKEQSYNIQYMVD